MSFLSICGERINSFYFKGFLPAKKELRAKELSLLNKIKEPIIIMDTPYRLNRLLEDLNQHYPERKCILGLSLTTDEEQIVDGTAKTIIKKIGKKKALHKKRSL